MEEEEEGGGHTSGLSDSYDNFIWNIKLKIALTWERINLFFLYLLLYPYRYLILNLTAAQFSEFMPHASVFQVSIHKQVVFILPLSVPL